MRSEIPEHTISVPLAENSFHFQKGFGFKQGLGTGDATIRTKYQIRTRDRFGPKTNSAQNFNYL